MPTRRLPSNPNLIHLKYQAKDLLEGLAAQDRGVAQRVREFHPRFTDASDETIFRASFRLADAQLAIAREYGFRSWPRLKSHVESPELAHRLSLPHHEQIQDPEFRHAVDLLDAGAVVELREHLKRHPRLVHQHVDFEGGNYFRSPTLLEFVAENPIRRGSLPKSIVEIAKAILDAGPDQHSRDEALELVATGRVPRECGVQLSLICLLCDHGADPNFAIRAATLLREMQAVSALIENGARIDLPLAVALGRVDETRRLLSSTDAADRHLALAFAAQLGQTEIVRLLLDAGEEPNRYNPVGAHSHSTPLHQAALTGNQELVRLLIEHGARADTRDLLWGGTPADWAQHERKTQIEAYLRGVEESYRQNK